MIQNNTKMMQEDNAKTRETVKAFSNHPRPQPIFNKSKEENRSLTLSPSRTEENPSSNILATNLETETIKKFQKTPKNSGKKYQETPKNSSKIYQKTAKSFSLDEKSSPIIPAFLRPKVRNYQH